ncbi:PREDICTED: multidrug resistance-associated protein 5-like [Branchiostoma belcheri]|uniref:Multidrug resistance-associated protein 5-like n=1 Tax=Branchiostoma belcheri TaxID=7741 RepID=A0A6P4Y7B5_BRABE|nr:PREDICTED: multidrug resistance-associated protein 5-like [Branchiostoma belcheri]
MRTFSYHEALGFECLELRYYDKTGREGRLEEDMPLDETCTDYSKKKWKYKESAKTFIPVRSKPKEPSVNPLDDAGLLSFMTFSWLTPLIKMANKGKLTLDNIWQHSPLDTAEPNYKRFERLWQEEVERVGMEKASLPRTIWRFTRTRMLMTYLTLMICMIGAFLGPAFVIRNLLIYAESREVNWPLGVGLVIAMFVTEMSRSVFFAATWCLSYRSATRVLGAVLTLIFTKITRLRSLKDKTVGELVNLCANDGQRLFDATSFFILMCGAPAIFILGFCYTLYLIGPASLLGCSMFILFYPFQAGISRLTSHLRRKCIAITDKRVRTMNEILTCVKLIKMYAWEMPFGRAVSAVRSDERKVLEKAAYIQSFSISTSPLVPVLASILTIVLHVMTGNDLTASQAFTMLAIFNSMRFMLATLPFCVKYLAESRVALQRVKSLLDMEERKPFTTRPSDPGNTIEITGATFAWDTIRQEEEAGNPGTAPVAHGNTEKVPLTKDDAESVEDLVKTLVNIDLELPKGTLTGVCGSVGSGKSSLISGILGQMRVVCGTVGLTGSVAYVAQQAWIMNASVRDNILFGEDYDQQRYEDAVRTCSLTHDFNVLPAGDLTEIGERGINLSGGQKQRISLARAVYSNRDVYLLDDPLSAVDAHVGQHIFTHCIMGALKDKTVLFVTHQLQYLHLCDQVVLMKDGLIAEKGEHSQLMAAGEDYARMIQGYMTSHCDEETGEESDGEETEQLNNIKGDKLMRQSSMDAQRRKRLSSVVSSTSIADNGDVLVVEEEEEEEDLSGSLVTKEDIESGSIGWRTYADYFKAGGGYLLSVLVLLTFILAVGAMGFSNFWLSLWLRQGSGNTTITVGNETVISTSIRHHPDLHFYSLVYGMSIILVLFMVIIKGLSFMKFTLRASSNLHDKVFRSVFRSPMSFFDTTPTGRILNRFSKDLDEVDVRLPLQAEMFLQNSCLLLFSIVMVAYALPYFLIAIVPLAGIFLYIRNFSSSALRELKRLENVSRSPWFCHLTATVQGLATIHAYNKTEQTVDRFLALLDKNSMIMFVFHCAMRWLAVRLDQITITMSTVTALLVVVTHGSVPPALAGLALSSVIQMTGMFQFTVRLSSETEARFTSVQRINSYIKGLKPEAPLTIKETAPSKSWPSEGRVRYQKYNMRYREGLPLVLKDVSFSTKPSEKVGIVGRTGSGKSSLGVSLFRLVEAASGSISIDDINISTIGLEDLRSKLSIIPQDPVLFVGTVRYNLDPFEQYSDDQIWSALERTHMKQAISGLQLQLEAPVVENGDNFSVGERQLLCMARALLRHSKILMLDEATAAIDPETDNLIQTTIREAFSDCTMLTIAHRLNTVLTCDRILVMEDGEVVEFDSPSSLLADVNSHFYAMMSATNVNNQLLN